MKYDQIGKTYNHTRVPDERITNCIVSHLNLPLDSKVLDVGAGTGNYTYELAKLGFKVTALEPSETMRNQAKQHENLDWLPGFAEELPFNDNSFDGLICTLATHHFSNLSLCFQEMDRVVKEQGKIVIFSADPRICLDTCWITDYFKEIVEESCKSQPKLDEFKDLFEVSTRRKAAVHPFLLPHNLDDKFFFSGWRNPRAYLDEIYHAGISSLATAPKELVENNVERLNADLTSGKFYTKYGDQLDLMEYDCGYFFLVG
jgi:ubiquinone/menaquinone biosynthesis C-methylase UbiE